MEPVAPISNTTKRRLRLERRREILVDIERCGPLRAAALAMVEYAYAFSDPWTDENASFFEKKTEWVLAPDPWLALRLVHERKYAIHVSVGVFTLRTKREDLPLKNGRFSNWTRFTLTTPRQLPAAFLYLEEAYYEAENSFRRMHAKPKRDTGVVGSNNGA